MISYGIMQGRLTPSEGKGIQFFPFDNWEKEFEIGAQIGLDEIEWIFDYDRYKENPLWSEEGCKRILKVMARTGVYIHSVCFDYFMHRPFFKCKENSEKLLDENRVIVRKIISNMSSIGTNLIEIPLVDTSSVQNEDEKEKVIYYLREVADYALEKNIDVGLETDFPPGYFRKFIKDIRKKNVYANYDSGNSSGIGYDHYEEICSLDKLVRNIHIKDREFQGTTVQLGKGNANFNKVFYALKEIGYNRAIVLQAARMDDGHEVENITRQLEFVKRYVEEYEIGE